MKVNKNEAKEVITAKLNEWIRKGYAIEGYINPEELVDMVWTERNHTMLTTLKISSKQIKISILWWEYLGVDMVMSAVNIDTNADLNAFVTWQQAHEIIDTKVHDWVSQGLAIDGYDSPTSLVNKSWHEEEDPNNLKLIQLDTAGKRLLLQNDGKEDIIMFAKKPTVIHKISISRP